MESQTYKLNGHLEFDVIVDGKYEKRVSHGVLFEETDFGMVVRIGKGNQTMIFGALASLLEFVHEQGLDDEFTKWLEEDRKESGDNNNENGI